MEYLRVEWESVNRLARNGWHLVPMPPYRDRFVMQRPLAAAAAGCHADHLMEDP